ncbi:MAG: hydroxyacid dehydrogenase, partial [bacterium]
MTFKVLVSDKLDNEAVEIFRSAENIEVDVKVGLTPEELASVIGEYDALIVRSATKVTPDIIAKADRLKIVGRAGVGVDNVDRNAATKRGIIIMNTPGGNTISTAEHTWSHILSLARNVSQANQSMREGRWDKSKYKGVELFGKTLGIIGAGRVGSIVASRALAFGMKVLAHDPYASDEHIAQMGFEPCGLDKIYAESDFISFHCILNDETRHIIDDTTLAKMKKGVRIINCARGGIIDEEALLRALESEQVAGAALDVFEKEPPDPDSALVKHPRCVTT